MLAAVRCYPIRVEHRCPYCETSQGFECEALIDYAELVQCLVCRVSFVIAFKITVTADARKLEGGQRESEKNLAAMPKARAR